MNNKTKPVKVGIVAEYNPFHNGHIFQLKWIKQKFPNSKIYVAMSYKFSQRAEYICVSWKVRKKIAKKYGVNKFIKLKNNISNQAAHIFASEAVKKLNKHKINYLVFGSETADITQFLKVAYILKYKKTEYNALLKKYLKTCGNSFPKSSSLAMQDLANYSLNTPNDILGIEYVKTIVENNFNIRPLCIKRTIGFHSDQTQDNFASATHIRKMVLHNQDISKYTPMDIKKFKQINETYLKFQKIINKSSLKTLRSYKMVDEGIENLFKKNIYHKTYEEFIEACISKRYTRSRIKRTYLSIYLKTKKNSKSKAGQKS